MADYVPVSVYMGIGLVVSLGKMLKRCFSEAFFKKWILVTWANDSVGTQPCLTAPSRSAGRSNPNCPWYVGVLYSPSGFEKRAMTKIIF